MEILVDVNVLLALVDPCHLHHSLAKRFINRQDSNSAILICRVTQMGVLRLLVNHSVMQGEPMTLREAWSWYGNFIQDPSVFHVAEPSGLQARWAELCFPFGSSPKILTDAYLAAFAISGGFKLASFDNGFRQFEDLDLELLGG